MRLWRIILGCTLAGMGVLFAAAFYDRYWRWRDCFSELGRCFDPATQDVYLEQSGVAYGALALLCLAAGVAALLRRRQNAGSAGNTGR